MKKKSQNIVVINSVPINGGDEALLKATLLLINDNFPDASIVTLCNNPVLYRKYLPEFKLDWDWEYAILKSDSAAPSLTFKAKRKLRYILKNILKLPFESKISRFLGSKRESRVFNTLKKADFVISSAGGYFHDFYGYEKRLSTLEFIHHTLNVPYFIFYQSVGPFWEKQQFGRLKLMFANAQKIILRESFSENHLKTIGYDCSNVVVSSDIAFYLNRKYGKQVDLNKNLKNIAVNFRKWKYEAQSEYILEKAVSLCEKLLKEGYKLIFISTCQGVNGYTDDSEFAMQIINCINPKLQNGITINKGKMSLESFLKFLENCDAYIGMRLHCAILSLISGIPVLNIAYEDKSLGIFQALELDACSFSYKEDITNWFIKTDDFMDNYNNYLKLIVDKRKEVEMIVEHDFKRYIKINKMS